ncbi:MAG: carbohydrate kinase family protein, partial [Candidatus Woesebacteria bacterium]
PEKIPTTPWIYLTSMGMKFETVYARVVEHVRANPTVKLAFNPGSRQIRVGVEKFKNVLEVAYALYVNRKEAEVITGFEGSEGKEKELLRKVCAMGPKVSIVTDGVNGSFVFDGEKFYKAGVLPVDSYERTGAGDAFGSGCISALIKGKDFREALLWGTVNSASVIGYAGAQRGLLREDEIGEWLERAKSCKVEVEEF